MSAEIPLQTLLAIAGIVAGALVVFWLVHKVVKLVLSLVIVVILSALALVYCVRTGIVSRETADRINPLKSERVKGAVSDAGTWAGDKVKDAARKALSVAVDAALGGGAETNAPTGFSRR